jgi:hypothetical protein
MQRILKTLTSKTPEQHVAPSRLRNSLKGEWRVEPEKLWK